MEKDCITAFESLRKRTNIDEDRDLELMIKSIYMNGPEGTLSGPAKSKKLKVEKKVVTMSDLLDEKTSRIIENKGSPRSRQPPPLGGQQIYINKLESSTGESNSNSTISKESQRKSVTTSHSFKTRGYSQKWKEKDTKLFFKALSVFGTDFSMVSLLFKGRNRNQIINKYHKEEKDNMKKVENSLKIHKQGNSKVLKRCNNLLNQPIKLEDTLERKRLRVGSGTSLDSLDEMIYEELDDQIHRSLQSKTQGSIASFANTLDSQPIAGSNPTVQP